jgi:hypothetical protein
VRKKIRLITYNCKSRKAGIKVSFSASSNIRKTKPKTLLKINKTGMEE